MNTHGPESEILREEDLGKIAPGMRLLFGEPGKSQTERTVRLGLSVTGSGSKEFVVSDQDGELRVKVWNPRGIIRPADEATATALGRVVKHWQAPLNLKEFANLKDGWRMLYTKGGYPVECTILSDPITWAQSSYVPIGIRGEGLPILLDETDCALLCPITEHDAQWFGRGVQAGARAVGRLGPVETFEFEGVTGPLGFLSPMVAFSGPGGAAIPGSALGNKRVRIRGEVIES